MRHAFPLLFVLLACNPYSPDLGSSPFWCGPVGQEPRCPDGYTCQEGLGSDTGTCVNGGPDAKTSMGNCMDDSTLEPNDMIAQAWVTNVDTAKTFRLSSLAICPQGDKDNYAITIRTQNENVEVTVEFDSAGAALQGAIASPANVPIKNMTPVSGASNKISVSVANLPTGMYYIQVYGPITGTVQTNPNYSVDVAITGP